MSRQVPPYPAREFAGALGLVIAFTVFGWLIALWIDAEDRSADDGEGGRIGWEMTAWFCIMGGLGLILLGAAVLSIAQVARGAVRLLSALAIVIFITLLIVGAPYSWLFSPVGCFIAGHLFLIHKTN